MASTSHYDVLGLVGEGKSASTEEIKRAYKSAALRCHPDKNGGDVAAFVAVNRAFETLSDPASRRAYDAYVGWMVAVFLATAVLEIGRARERRDAPRSATHEEIKEVELADA